VASSIEEAHNTEWNLILAEIFHHLFTPYDIELLFQTQREVKYLAF
jgi:hypothetical protein